MAVKKKKKEPSARAKRVAAERMAKLDKQYKNQLRSKVAYGGRSTRRKAMTKLSGMKRK